MWKVIEEFRDKFKTLSIMERIDFVRVVEGLDQRSFAVSIGYTQSGYSTLKKRGIKHRNQMKTVALALEAVYGVDHNWILTGELNDRRLDSNRKND